MTTRKELPPITLSGIDFDRLERLVAAAADKFPQTVEFLEREMARAHVVPSDAAPSGVVAMDRQVEFRDNGNGQTRTVTLVYPDQADFAAGRISVLSPVGAALLGLSAGQSIDWQPPSGDGRSLTVLRVG
ncbi:nucleoside diphosphate kinase regulator [Xanthobacteraceae bacterium Astr-EGSB]|uniref:nucleoside diphosphate kinase regulator n=1 Tax=Astrobacterium formosum TaxID=3069710 RepID=UPI0027B6FAA2|nr:nucleoside diphosphate kinase regulator [Xanthobacteraceae bacterium Astr-EGSB]